MNKSYTASFRKFTEYTNEKEVLARNIIQLTSIHDGSTVLDIGAGAGDISERLLQVGAFVDAVEPNHDFIPTLSRHSTKVMPQRWENVHVKKKYDIVLSCHSITYFTDDTLPQAIEKMMAACCPGGKIVIVTVDQNLGSWREVHEEFYKTNGIKKRKTSQLLPVLLQGYQPEVCQVATSVSAPSVEAMIEVLAFDFSDYPKEFSSSKEHMRKMLESFQFNGEVILDVYHQILTFTP